MSSISWATSTPKSSPTRPRAVPPVQPRRHRPALHWDGFSVEQANKKNKRCSCGRVNIEAFKLHVERKVAERRKSASIRTPSPCVQPGPT